MLTYASTQIVTGNEPDDAITLFSTCAELIFDPITGDLTEDLTDRLAEYPDQLILFDHITLDETYRGSIA